MLDAITVLQFYSGCPDSSEKTPPDRPADDVDVGCFSGTDLRIAWLWHESTSLQLYIYLLLINILFFLLDAITVLQFYSGCPDSSPLSWENITTGA